MAPRSDNSQRLTELRMKHGRPPASPSEPKAETPTTLREDQPRFPGSGERPPRLPGAAAKRLPPGW